MDEREFWGYSVDLIESILPKKLHQKPGRKKDLVQNPKLKETTGVLRASIMYIDLL